jgi:hypothetical protein
MGVRGSYTDWHIDFGGSSVWYHVLKVRFALCHEGVGGRVLCRNRRMHVAALVFRGSEAIGRACVGMDILLDG